MPLPPYIPNPLVVRVSDRQVGGITYCQFAYFVEDRNFYEKGAPCIDLKIDVYLHEKLPDGTPGVKLDMPGFAARPFTLRGRNDTLVVADDPTGEHYGDMLAQRATLPDGSPDPSQNWQAVIDHFGALEMMLQGNFYEQAANQPIVANSQRRKHILAADALGYFA